MKNIKSFLLSGIILSLIPFLANAATTGENPSSGTTGSNPSSQMITIKNPLTDGVNTLPQLVTLILNNVIMPLATVFIVVMIIYSGFKYITAQGKPEAIKQASQGLLYVLIGAAVLLGAAGISAAVSGTICGPLINCG